MIPDRVSYVEPLGGKWKFASDQERGKVLRVLVARGLAVDGKGIQLMISVRDFRASDSEQVLTLARDLQSFELDLYDRMMPVEDIGDWYIAALLDQCANEDGAILVAEEDDELIGFATIFTKAVQKDEFDELPFTYAYVSHISVRPSARGSGTGKLLLHECEARARAAGRQWLRIGVLANNPGARNLYRQLGFHDHLVILEKPLDPSTERP